MKVGINESHLNSILRLIGTHLTTVHIEETMKNANELTKYFAFDQNDLM